jgi:hypothetical protein
LIFSKKVTEISKYFFLNLKLFQTKIFLHLEYNQLNQRVNEFENSNTILEAQLLNKEFKSAVLNQIEEMSNKQSYEVKNLKSKIIIVINISNIKFRKNSNNC